MNRDPDFSAQAKRLKVELAQLGVEMSHAQSMELLARTQGARTLHVAKARNHKQGFELSPRPSASGWQVQHSDASNPGSSRCFSRNRAESPQASPFFHCFTPRRTQCSGAFH